MARFRAVALSTRALGLASLRSQAAVARLRTPAIAASQLRLYTASAPRRQQVEAFQSQLGGSPNASSFYQATAPANPQNLTEKIFQRYAIGLPPGKTVKAGDFISIMPHRCMTHDNSYPVATKAMNLGLKKIYNSGQIVMALDHDVSNQSESNLRKYRLIEEFARKHGTYFYPAGHGIAHQIMIDEGHAWPGTLCVASDSHSTIYGGIGCLGTPVVRSDAAGIWSVGSTWLQQPPVAKITFTGLLPVGVTGKDVILSLCSLFNNDEVLNHCVEFAGSEQTLASIPIDDRLTISNMTTEWGALSGLFPVDDALISWYRGKASAAAVTDSPAKERINHERIDELSENRLAADPGATYAKEFYLNLSTLSPFVTGPNTVKVANPLSKLEPQNIKIDKAYLVSCTNSRASDIAAAARVFREASKDGKPAKVADGVRFYLAAASLAEQRIAEEAGDWKVLLDAGAIELPASCGPCIGLGTGLLEDGETGISASNRNYPGRMGSRSSKAYLASPEIVAASAIKGAIAGPGWYQKPEGVEKVIIGEGSGDYAADKARSIESAFDKIINEVDSMIASAEGGQAESTTTAAKDEALADILPGFPEKIEGEIVFLDNDNINTDGIYPGKYTYQDNLPKEKMAEVCMENYDPEFGKLTKPGDILVTGFNFGCGSSREQAATSILARDIPLVIAGSLGNIFSRNSINNALVSLEIPRLVERLREAFKEDGDKKPLTRRTGWKILWDVRRSKVVITEKDGSVWEQKVSELPPSVQEIIAVKGLENWVKSKLQALESES
ncbi:homoaconitase-like protein [Trichoderma reesei QM6a]|uniref:Homoaconitase, mitochondrial n=1 Tax=Hypocrea jecorina (strain QM6a) TaxID=431241 RepID=G0RU29_HYPJQ|nr:homoaconitase-like protein [Trichoderma reesei QM6a]EGR45316.1 homoaconitase-like protein [Trichoderma reesei QM6a]